ncbi:MAG TPA: glycosyl hydrolase family 65 protein [Acidimicrobiales bacterium]|nr:glycosyl hydrolase family 65 protein [Acidimicrobiales bacterium]
MNNRAAYSIDPWILCETNLDLDILAESESLFALSNGHIGLRGNLDEGEPFGQPGSYLNGVYESRPLPYAEAGFGYPEDGQTVINITNAKIMRLLINDEPFDIRYGQLISHVRSLDFRTGILERDVDWISPEGQGIRVHSQRIVSFTQRSVAAIVYEVEPINSPLRVVVQSELVTNEAQVMRRRDPRVSAILESPLEAESNASSNMNVTLVHRTKASGLRVAAAMDHLAEAPSALQINTESFPDLGRVTFSAALQPGERLRIIKFAAYGWSAERSEPAMRDQVEAALAAARQTGWDGLVAEQRATLDRFWERADIEVDGDPEIQQAARFTLFHVFQAGVRAEGRAIPAKGLTGPGYDGHAFWDTEIFVLPVLTYTAPEAVAHALRWRHETLPLARERAHQLGLKGAVFPWRTISGAECSAYWPAGTAAFHVGADIASAVVRYVGATGDDSFARGIGLELLAETARLWRSLGHHDVRGRFCIDGVTGPDEYSAMADNNVYTNLMAQHNLLCAAEAAAMYPDESKRLHIDQEEMATWRDAAKSMYIPYDNVLKVHPQADDFTNHEVWDFETTSDDQYPLLLNFPYFNLYRKQVVKQADLVLAMHLCPDAFTDAEKEHNFTYYEALTVRDSSLSACTQAVIAAEVGYVELAHNYLTETALMDLDDLDHNTRDGLHLAACAGTWIALVGGLAGMRERKGTLCFAPRLPEGITRLAFTLTMLNQRIHIEVTPKETSYRLIDGEGIKVFHYDKAVKLSLNRAVTRPTLKLVPSGHPTQPRGREPRAHRRTI